MVSARGAATAAAAFLLGACGREEPPALRVGELDFAAESVADIIDSERSALADIAGWGLAVRDRRADSLFAPLARRAAERSRLETLSLVLGAEVGGITEEELRRAYRAAPEWELTVRHVVRLALPTAPAAERVQALGLAEEVALRARAGEDFAALAAEFSEEPGAAARGGLLEPGREGSWVDPFWEAAVALEPGAVSEVVESEYGFHVLRLDERRPVPFAEADRAAVLRRVVPTELAAFAMEQWAGLRPPTTLAETDVATVRMLLAESGRMDSAVLARGEGGGVYTARDLALSWASLGPEERQRLERADEASFRGWLEMDIQDALWAQAAAELNAPPLRGAHQTTMNLWRGSGAGWSSIFGFAPGMSDDDVREAALGGVRDRGQEARIARGELEALRPLLRALYPLEEPGAATSVSRSEIRNSDITG